MTKLQNFKGWIVGVVVFCGLFWSAVAGAVVNQPQDLSTAATDRDALLPAAAAIPLPLEGQALVGNHYAQQAESDISLRRLKAGYASREGSLSFLRKVEELRKRLEGLEP